jgi:diguanylate cyclase (GGDEF)-like protein/PAS domain S-box-containing protein
MVHKIDAAARRQSEARMRSIVESSLDAVVGMDETGRITDWNRQAEQTFGWAREQAIGQDLAGTMIPQRYRKAHQGGIRAFLESGVGPILNKRIEISALHRDGHEFPVELTVLPLRLGKRWTFSAMVRDLSGQKLADEVLQRLFAAMEVISDAIYLVDRSSMSFIHVNATACQMRGQTREDMLAMGPAQVLGTPRAELERRYDAIIASGGTAAAQQLQRTRPDGSEVWVELRRHALRSGERWMIVTLVRDITGQKKADDRIRRLNRVYAVLSGIYTLIVRVRERDGLFREACQVAVEQGQFMTAWIGLVDRSAMKILPVAWAGAQAQSLALNRDRFPLGDDGLAGSTLAARAVWQKAAVVSNDIRGDPRVAYVKEHLEHGISSIAVLPLLVADEVVGVFNLYAGETGFFDDEEMKLLTELVGNIAFAIDHLDKRDRLNYLAYYDVLTGLANRSLFLDRVTGQLRSAAGAGSQLALFLVDLERFRNINDSLGRPAGDALLKQVGQWLAQNSGDANLVARVDADHFAVLLPEVRKQGNVAHLLESTADALQAHPFRLGESEFRIAARTGVALFPQDGSDADTLYRHAEAALKKAKASGERYVFYSAQMTDAVAGKLTLENQLRRALDQGEFVLHYQPKVNLASGKVSGAEALIRWNDPGSGLVAPSRFIPVLEETGLIQAVGRWAVRQAIGDYLRWRAAGLSAVRIAVNVSPLQLRHPGFVGEIRQAIALEAHAAEGLELEITESLIMEDVKHNVASLSAIRAMGVRIAIDDFGTGFSSLSHLARLPVDTLKIDRSFIVDMTGGPQGLALVSTIINLAHSLKLKVVAEGVETDEQQRLLHLLRCDEMQGYLFCKPVPAEVLAARFL